MAQVSQDGCFLVRRGGKESGEVQRTVQVPGVVGKSVDALLIGS